jgi:hypothetical protein
VCGIKSHVEPLLRCVRDGDDRKRVLQGTLLSESMVSILQVSWYLSGEIITFSKTQTPPNQRNGGPSR